MTTFEQNQERLSRQFFGQSGKTVAQMQDEFEQLASMHNTQPDELSRDRRAACDVISNMLAVAGDERYGGPMRAAFLHAAVVLVIAYQETFPGAVSKLRQRSLRRIPGGALNLSKGQMSALVLVNAGMVSFTRTADGLKFFRDGTEVTEDVSALLGVGLVAVSGDLDGVVTVTAGGVQELR